MRYIKRKFLKFFILVFILTQCFNISAIPIYAAGEEWNIIDDDFDNISAWTKLGGTNGSVTQNDGNITVVHSGGAYYYLTKSDFTLPTGAFTYEVRAKANAPEPDKINYNEFSVRTSYCLIKLFLTYGTEGTAQDKAASPTKTYILDTTVYHTYRVVVHADITYDLYVDGTLAWSGATGLAGGTNIFKIGGDTNLTANMDVDYAKLGSGEIIPGGTLSASISPNNCTYDKNSANQADVSTTITWNDAVSITDVKNAGLSIGAESYSVSGSALIIKKEYLATQPTGSLALTIEFDKGNASTLTITIADTTQEVPFPLPKFYFDRVIVDPADMKYNPTGELINPTIIKASDYFSNPLGTYYLYTAPHNNPGGILLLYSDSLEGPWTEYTANPVISNKWEGYYNVPHVSSPDAFWNKDAGKLYMYFHGDNSVTRVASSTDGIHFTYEKECIRTTDLPGTTEISYARVFEYTIPSKGNKYIMLFMGCYGANPGVRNIYLAWSDDGLNWTPQSEPLITPDSSENGNISSPFYFQKNGRHYVAYHSSSGNMHVTEVGAEFDLENHLGLFYDSMAIAPDNARSAAPVFVTEGDTTYMIYEAGQRGGTKIALATSKLSAPPTGTWNIINDDLGSYNLGWGPLGSTDYGFIDQKDGYVRVVDNVSSNGAAYHNISKYNFVPPEGAFTFEVRAKANEMQNVDLTKLLNEITVKSGKYIVTVWIPYGKAAKLRSQWNITPSGIPTLDTTVYHTYRIVVHFDYSYDLYVDNNFFWSFSKLAVGTNTEELFKIGADANRLADFDIDYIKMGSGEILPATEPAEIYSIISPYTGSFDKNPVNQADVGTTITLNDATAVTDVKKGGVSIGTGAYAVNGNTLTISKEYLATQPLGYIYLRIEFDKGSASILTVNIADTTALSPETGDVLANSINDYSNTQGVKGWFYGVYNAATTTYQPGDFLQSTYNDSENRWKYFDDRNIYISSDGMRFGGEKYIPVRRWVSNVEGQINISGTISNTNANNEEIDFRIFVDGVQVGTTSSVKNNPEFSFNEIAAVHAGSVVDMVLIASGTDVFYDTSEFSAEITYTGNP